MRDKPRTAQVLAACGIATPVTWLVDSPALLRRLPADRFPLLLKPHAGDNARGIVLVRDAEELDDLEWRDSMVLAQEYVDSGAVDLKVYAAGERVWAVRRPSPLVLPGRTVPTGIEPVEVTPQHLTLAAPRPLRRFAFRGRSALICGEGAVMARQDNRQWIAASDGRLVMEAEAG